MLRDSRESRRESRSMERKWETLNKKWDKSKVEKEAGVNGKIGKLPVLTRREC